MNKQVIYGGCWVMQSFSDLKKQCGTKSLDVMTSAIKSGCRSVNTLTALNSSESEGQETRKPGVLYSWVDIPIAYWDIPTLNNMIFSRELWEQIHQDFKSSLETGCHWGESGHSPESEINLSKVACRVTDFHCADNNVVLGNVDILDTATGRDMYALAKAGTLGLSSRGFGVLEERRDGTQIVVPSEYRHVCWDLVAVPAVPVAVMSTKKSALRKSSVIIPSSYTR